MSTEQDSGDYARHYAWSPSGAQLLRLQMRGVADRLGVAEAHVQVWDVALGRAVHRAVHEVPSGESILGVGWGQSGPVLLTQRFRSGLDSANRGSLTLWDLERGAALWQTDEPGFQSGEAAWSPDGRRLIVGGRRLAWVIDAGSGVLLQLLEEDNQPTHRRWSPDGLQALIHCRVARWELWLKLWHGELARMMLTAPYFP